MHCKYCGTELADKSKMCYNCGRFLGDEEAEKRRTAQRRKIWIGLGILTIAFIFILTTFGMNYRSQKATNEVISTQVNRASANNLGATTKDFITAFNLHQLSGKYALSIPETIEIVKSDTSNSFQHRLSDQLLLQAFSGKYDNKLLEIRLIAQPANQNDLVLFISCIGILIDTFSSEVPINERRAILEELGFVKGASLDDVNNQAIRGEVTYTLQHLNDIGFVLTVKNTNRR